MCWLGQTTGFTNFGGFVKYFFWYRFFFASERNFPKTVYLFDWPCLLSLLWFRFAVVAGGLLSARLGIGKGWSILKQQKLLLT
jgi:hypothetical protein